MCVSEKQKILNFITNLQDDLSSEEILKELLIYFKVQNSLDAIENNQTITNDEMKELILKC